MPAKKFTYNIEQVDCEKNECNKKFNVIISPIYTVGTRAVAEVKLKTLKQYNTIVTLEENDNYFVAKCICGHSQRVFLKIKGDE